MNWCKKDKRECIGDICSMRPQPKELETYEDCQEFAIRGQRRKLNLYYDDFGYDTEKLTKNLEVLLYDTSK